MEQSTHSILDLDIRADNVEEELLKLFSNIDDLDQVGKELKYDLKNLIPDLKRLKHNDDIYHHGETILDHTREVLEDLEEYIEDMEDDRKKILRLAAALHDIGKAVSYGWNEEKNKPTFHGHAKESVKIAAKMLEKYKVDNEELLANILELVEEHDAFLQLANERKGKTSLKYLKGFSKKNIALGNNLDNLVAIAKADNKRSINIEKDLENIIGIIDDLSAYKEQEKENAAKEVQRKAREKENIGKYKDEIISLANGAVGDAGTLYPDISAINRILGMNKKFGVIKTIKDILMR